MKLKGYLLALVSAVSYGLIPLFILPIKASNFPMDATLFYRFLISALFILLFLLYKRESLKINKTELLILLVLGLLYALSSDFLFIGYELLTPGIASTVLFVYPVFVALILALFFKEKITRFTLLSLLVTFSGIVVLSANGSGFNINFLGLFVCVLCALFYAVYMVIVNKANMKNVSGTKITFYSLLFSATYYLIKTVSLDESLVASPSLLLHISIFALVTTVFSITALIYAIQYIGSTPTSIMGALEPVVAVIISVCCFGEFLSWNLIVGVILILFGVLINMVFDRNKIH
ncbi:putative DMT superfamily transporter inner membrane protein [compost metagenome]